MIKQDADKVLGDFTGWKVSVDSLIKQRRLDTGATVNYATISRDDGRVLHLTFRPGKSGKPDTFEIEEVIP